MALDPKTPPAREAVVCVATDTDPAEAAAAVASDLSRRLARPLVFVDVQVPVPPVAASYPPVAPVPPLPHEPPEPPRPVPRDVEALAQKTGLGAIGYETRVGNPADILTAVAEQPTTAFVVAPDDGSGAFATALGGNPARRALRDVACPVILVPPECDDGLADPPTVVAAVPSDPAQVQLVAVAADLATELRGRLVLARAWIGPDDDEAIDRARAAVPASMTVEIIARSAEATAAIESIANEVDADLVVLGPPAHGPVLSALLGSTTHDLAAHAHVPLVVVPEQTA